MLIYQEEKDLAELINDNRIVIDSAIDILDTKKIIADTIDAANPNQEDLFYVESVLASIGWNGNDDVFLKEEMWKARHTPIDKQFNFMHREGDIIGHITSSRVVSDGEVISDSTPLEQLPDDFDIVVGSVIYRKFNNVELQTRANKLIEEIKSGDWFVSMECWHAGFDYAIQEPDGQQKIIARTEETAFLTKYLRRYKGTGEYKGNKIARVLRDFYFSGKGLVSNPANKKSVFVGFSDTNEKIAAEEQVMSVTYTEAQYKELEIKLADAQKQLKEFNDKTISQEVDNYKTQIAQLESDLKTLTDNSKAEVDQLNDKIKDLESQVSVASEVGKNKDEQIKTLSDEKASLEAQVNEFNESAKKAQAEKVRADRIAQLGKVEVDTEKAQALVDQFIDVSDEVFTTLVNSFPAKRSVSVSTEVLDSVDFDDEPVMALASTDELKELRTKTSEWLKQGLKRR